LLVDAIIYSMNNNVDLLGGKLANGHGPSILWNHGYSADFCRFLQLVAVSKPHIENAILPLSKIVPRYFRGSKSAGFDHSTESRSCSRDLFLFLA
jgi:hypothetical protein